MPCCLTWYCAACAYVVVHAVANFFTTAILQLLPQLLLLVMLLLLHVLLDVYMLLHLLMFLLHMLLMLHMLVLLLLQVLSLSCLQLCFAAAAASVVTVMYAAAQYHCCMCYCLCMSCYHRVCKCPLQVLLLLLLPWLFFLLQVALHVLLPMHVMQDLAVAYVTADAMMHTALVITLGLDHCIAGNCNVHCESHLWLHPESARP